MFHPQVPYGGRRELAPFSCPLTSVACMHTPKHQTDRQTDNCNNHFREESCTLLTPSLLPRPVFTLQYQTSASRVLRFECQLLKPETQAYGILLNSPGRDNPAKSDGKILARQAAWCLLYLLC